MRAIDNQQSEAIRRSVVQARRVMIATAGLLGLVGWSVIVGGMWLSLFLLDNLLHLPAGVRLALSLGAAGVMIFALWRNVLMPIRGRGSLERTALMLERKYAVPENFVINALQFEGRRFSGTEQLFARQTINSGRNLIAAAGHKGLWQIGKMGRWAAVLLVVLALWSLYGLKQPRHAGNAWARFVQPLADIPPAGSVRLKITPSRDISLAQKDDLRVVLEMARPKGGTGLSDHPRIVWQSGREYLPAEPDHRSHAVMRRQENRPGVYSYTFTGVERSFAFRVFAADTYSRSIKVTITPAPHIAESQFYVTPPAYTGAPVVSSLGPPEPMVGLAGAQARVELKVDRPTEQLWWKGPEETVAFEPVGDIWQAATRLTLGGSYQVQAQGKAMDRRVTIAEGTVSLQKDRPPQIDFATTERNRAVNPGARLQFDIEAVDDFGVKDMWVTMQTVRADTDAKTIKLWSYQDLPAKRPTVTESLLLSIDTEVFRPGGSYILQAHCQDFSPSGKGGSSQPLLLQIRSLEELTMPESDPQSQAFAELEKAIEAQQDALSISRNVLTNLDDVIKKNNTEGQNRRSLRKHQIQLQGDQSRVGGHLSQAWKVSSPPRPAFVHKLVELRDGEHAQAVEKIKGLIHVELLSGHTVSVPLKSIERLQAFILEELIALKGAVAQRVQSQVEKAAADLLEEEVELPSDALAESLKNMINELDEFITRQKQIMHDRLMIMDKPPEDFTDEDNEELEVLALDQSKLAEILAQAVNDFTNLDLQDFGDNAMVDSMKSIFEESDELADLAREGADQRTVRVDAHRLETETVEMAEEIMINCEATLGVYDNIQFIAEIPEDEQLVAPLAELPSELEDWVADLITSEEEMAPEVEDIGSYLNSLDHTAGPVADGTISSTSAKGLTGDQKPEDNVIQGRSGAGRSGMSDGQLVESVAKALPDNEYGLRERISNTPLESGQVEDEDLGAQTGGTGLGKSTDGTSPFGLGGRLPPKVLDMMRAAAQRQNNIMGAARELAPRLKAHNLPVAELEKSIEAMDRVEKAIGRGDGIAIRRAYDEAVNSLNQSHRAVSKKTRIQYRRDQALTKKLGDKFATDRRARLKGYEHMIAAYFEALARQDEASRKANENE